MSGFISFLLGFLFSSLVYYTGFFVGRWFEREKIKRETTQFLRETK